MKSSEIIEVKLDEGSPQSDNCLDCMHISSEFIKGVPHWFCKQYDGKNNIKVSRKTLCKKFKKGV